MTPKVSIIIPVYHVEEYIVQCLQSVANQTMNEGVECIIVDDCGGDKSIEMANEFINKYNGPVEYKIIYRECNGGLSAARNSGIDVATGDYLYFLDSDDELLPNCIQSMFSLVDKYGYVDLVQGMFVESGKRLKQRPLYEIPEFTLDRKVIKGFLLTYRGDIIPAQTKMVLRMFLLENKLYFKDGIIHEDNYWTFFLAKHVSSMAYSSERTYMHRHNPNSITHKINIGREIYSYNVILMSFCSNIDNLLKGKQKELIFYTMLTVLNCHYYQDDTDKFRIIKTFLEKNLFIQKQIVKIYIKNHNSILKSIALKLLIYLYRLEK